MGTYLSTPVTEKNEESSESLDCPEVPCSWGVVDMQGWRKSMEDSHVAATDIQVPKGEGGGDSNEGESASDAKIFGVFDGHGGPEVARFCGLYMVSVLTQQPTWKEGGVKALPVEGENPADSKVGKALRSAFHALDRMIDDPERRDEINHLKSIKPQPGERRNAVSIPGTFLSSQPGATPAEDTDINQTEGAQKQQEVNVQEEAKTEANEPTTTPVEPDGENNDDDDDGDKKMEATTEKDGETDTTETREEDSAEEDDDSTDAVGKEEAARQDRDMMDDIDSSDDDNPASKETAIICVEESPEQKPAKVTSMFQKILSLGATAGQVVVKVGSGEANNSTAPTESKATVAAKEAPATGPSASQPTIVKNGRMMCNLPDHPIHAGATAIVAVIAGRTLTVANAGDSRAVLCRAGGAVTPLSYDHKPHQEREMSRITSAGGFVNHFGRVNANLNLSRSIGDLKYKQVPGIGPADQIITAEPDIMQLSLAPDDEFIILGCDGIWDCLTNEAAVQFVRDRIDTHTTTEIGVEMLDQIISDDPRVTQGIGGDNMTVMIIDLQPMSRTARQGPVEYNPPVDLN